MADVELTPTGPAIAPARKPKTSIYIYLLIVAVICLFLGCLFLFLEIRRQGGFGQVRGRISSARPVAVSLVAATDLPIFTAA